MHIIVQSVGIIGVLVCIVGILDIIAGEEKDDCYYAVRFAFWSTVTMLLIGAAVCIGVFVKSL